MPTITYDQLSLVPSDLQEFATTDDATGKVSVKVVPTVKLDQFRANNTKFQQERDAMEQLVIKYVEATGVPMEEVEDKLPEFITKQSELTDIKKKVDDGKLVAGSSLEEATAIRVADVTKTYQAQIADTAKERDAQKDRAKRAESALDTMKLKEVIGMAAADPDISMHSDAINYVLQDAAAVFKIIDGKITPKTSEGTTIYGSDGTDPLTMKEWLGKYRESSPFLFKDSSGGGAAGGAGKGTTQMTQEQFEALTPAQKIAQGRLQRPAA